jgi:early secretory antigenic target protein ESAT-6
MGDQFDSLLQGQVDIAQSYSRITRTLEDLEKRVNPMIQTRTTPAQEAYLRCKKQWDEAAADLATVLNSIGQAIGEAQDSYRPAESSANGTWA